uniref:E3 ubiquitin-protein ligase n=1 Tax=Tetraodon nigroviridis TaxID=99883 RepID=H3DJ15_TETNG
WLEAADLRVELLQYLKEQVPQNFCLDPELSLEEEDVFMQVDLLHPLECFLFGEDPQKGLEKLKQGYSSSQLCGRVFKEGQTVYSCRSEYSRFQPGSIIVNKCQNEKMFVLFSQMHSSSGGGFCDCGDVEAWKIGPYCSKHDPGAATSSATDECSLEPELYERAEKLFRELLQYVADMLLWEENLSAELQPRTKDNMYYCVLYNDEHHSFDHVVYSLQRSINCEEGVAEMHTTVTDKEGRRAVKMGTLRSCQHTKDLIKSSSEHISLQPLRVEILHSAVMAHQTFALRLGSWFQKIIGYSAGFRQAFCKVALDKNPGSDQPCLISRLMLHDARMFKGARKIVHELIFCSMLLENEFKRLFALEFTKHFKQLQKDFINDDHERSISITALSVQIFTVPTLARQLIEEASVIKVIVVHAGNNVPDHCDETTPYHGILTASGLIPCCKGMEEVKRQFGQHIALEPEWEAGFYLQIQLRHILAMFQDWCSSDDKLLVLAFKECHRVLMECTNQPFQHAAVDYYMCKHILHVQPYKVSQQPVSIHLPITRLLAGLYLLMCRTGSIQHVEFDSFLQMTLDFTQLAEPALRCVVLAAQVSADMWRRNGLSLVSQVYYYQDVKCRDEMYDKDVLMLQIAASRMEPNHFLMWILLRFELFDYFNGGFSSKDQDELSQWNRVIEEMLFLLIVITGERYVPGVSHVTKEDVTMREVIHLLCIEPMAHSSLVKGLPENECHETGLESVITKVATFRKPGVSGHGLYEVKKECLVEFNPFFSHYSRIQHSKAEESQKKRRAQECNDKALCPPVPPAFCPAFSSVVNLLNCDIFIHILMRVLQRASEDRTEAMVQRALHLIGQALLEEKTQLEGRTVEEVTFDFSLKAQNIGLEHGKSVFNMLSRIKDVPSLETQKDMIKWLLQMFEVVKCLRDKSCPTASVSVETAKPEERAQDKEKAERKRKAEAAKLHRQKIMAQMSAMQKNFIESNKMLYDNMPESGQQGESAPPSESCAVEQLDLCIAIGPHRGSTPTKREALTCILCQEEQEVVAKSQAMVLTACVQRSTVLTHAEENSSLEGAGPYPLLMPPHLAVGTHTGSCGHVMHATCWQKYFEALQNTRNRLHTEMIFDLETGEYLCPLCKSLCNTVIPLIPLEPVTFNYENAELIGQHLTLRRWIQIISARIKGLKSVSQDNECPTEDGSAEVDALLSGESQPDYRSILSYGVQEPTKLSDSIMEMLGVCATTVHTVGLQTAPNELCPRVPLMAWLTCAFTVQSIENILQEEEKPLFGSLQNRQLAGLKAVVQFSALQRRKCSQAVIQSHFSEMLAVLLPVICRENTPSILDVDFFHLLVGLVLSMPSLYQEETVDLQPSAVSSAYNHMHILHLVTMAHMLQILLSSTDFLSVAGGEETVEAKAAAELCSTVSQHTGRLIPDVSSSSVAEGVKKGIEPFLRCAALFFHCLTGVHPPEELFSAAVTPQGQMEALCNYLALPSNLFQLFQEHREVISPLLQRWCKILTLNNAAKDQFQTVRYPRKRNRLIDLPEDYTALLSQASHFHCPNSTDDEKKHPTLCLFCGAMLCSQNYCCLSQVDGEDVGACNAHAATCGAGVGIFLRVRECEIVLLDNAVRGCKYPAPYLDDYGETDPHLGRGNPLHLCPERYRKLNQLWQQHCILEEIVHRLEVVSVLLATDWQMF